MTVQKTDMYFLNADIKKKARSELVIMSFAALVGLARIHLIT